MKTAILFLLISFSAFSQVTLSDPHDLLNTKVDTLVKIKDANALFPCNSNATHKVLLHQIKYSCFPTYCEVEFWNQLSFKQQEVVQCSTDTRYIIDSDGNNFEMSDEYLKSINYNMVRHFITQTISDLFPENGEVVVVKVAPSVFTQFKGLPFERKIPTTSIHIKYHPFPGLYGFEMEIKYDPNSMGLTQILEYDLGGDLWSEFVF